MRRTLTFLVFAVMLLGPLSAPAFASVPQHPPKPLRVFLAGDSMALTLFGGLQVTGAPQRVTVTGGTRYLGCALEPYTDGIFLSTGLYPTSQLGGCPDWADEWRREVTQDRPNVAVLLIGVWDMYDSEINGRRIVYGSRESDQRLSALLDEAIRTLGSSGAKVVLLTEPYDSPVLDPSDIGWGRFDPHRVDHWNWLLRRAVNRHRRIARIVDLRAFVSPHGYTDTLDGVTPLRGTLSGPAGGPLVLHEDGVHFTPAASVLVARWLLPRLRAITRTQ
jgi:hypothetical protein